MKYVSALISVRDVNISRKFYEELFGLKLEFDFGWNISFTCGLSLQEHYDRLLDIEEDRITYKSHSFELYFEEDDLDSFARRLEERGDITYIQKMKEHNWGQRVIRFYDPDWHIIEVGEGMEAVVMRFMREGMTADEVAERTGFPPDFVLKYISSRSVN